MTGVADSLWRQLIEADYFSLWRPLIEADDLQGLQDLVAAGWNPQIDPVCPLAQASLQAKPRLVTWLLHLGLQPSCEAPVSALHAACSGPWSPERTEVVELLLKAGADLASFNRAGRTPLMCAAASGNMNLARHLLLRGADFTQTDGHGHGRTASDFVALSEPSALSAFIAMAADVRLSESAFSSKPKRSRM